MTGVAGHSYEKRMNIEGITFRKILYEPLRIR